MREKIGRQKRHSLDQGLAFTISQAWGLASLVYFTASPSSHYSGALQLYMFAILYEDTVCGHQAIVEQTERDHALLRERIKGLTGVAGVSRMEAGLAAARAASNPSTPVLSAGPPHPRYLPHRTPFSLWHLLSPCFQSLTPSS